MPAQCMPLGQIRMIEVITRVSNHAKFLHHAPRPHVARHRERDDLVEPDRFKRLLQHSKSAFRRQPSAPKFRGQPPANLHTWREMRLESWHEQPYITDQSLFVR